MREYIAGLVNLFTNNFRKRFFRLEKDRFIDFIKSELGKLDQKEIDLKEFKFIWCFLGKNICSTAKDEKIVLMAHYDTPIRNIPGVLYLFKCFGVGTLGKLITILIIIFVMIVVIGDLINILFPYLYCWNNLDLGIRIISTTVVGGITFILYRIVAPNPNNLNDNSSGIISVLGIVKYIYLTDKSLLKNISIIFTDREERGLHGARCYKGKEILPNLVINFDGVGLGKHLYLQATSSVSESLKNRVVEFIGKSLINKNLHVNSDFSVFSDKDKCIGISFLEKSKYVDSYYMPNMHTPADREIDEEHMERFITVMGDFVIDYIRKNNNAI